MSNNKIEIFKMNMEDFYEIKNILIEEFDDFWNDDILEQELKNENSYYIVAKNVQNNSIVGFAGLKIILDEADIMNIVTKKDSRNLGIGSLMLEKLIYIAKEKNIKKLTLEVNENNSVAIYLYEKYGFVPIAIRKNYYNNTYNAVIMQMSI